MRAGHRVKLQGKLSVLSFLPSLPTSFNPILSYPDVLSVQITYFSNTHTQTTLFFFFPNQPCPGSQIIGQHISYQDANLRKPKKVGLLMEINIKLVASWMGGIFLLGGLLILLNAHTYI